MRSFDIVLISCTLFFLSCKKDKITNDLETSVMKKLDTTVVENKEITISNTIDLEPIKTDIPQFNDKEADAFVKKVKKYFEQIAEANRSNNPDEILELQIRANDIDTEMQEIKNKLSKEKQKQLSDWYMKLVNAASK
ncbi:hypothetical protein [Apibacter adventoris]|uniref:hypothetical protein n=1 Tax=Apibacter adventoris TaxID=1679466 RepID=UPI000CF6C5D8|nr:hypothetical protein [Apibacter adventoris]PQL95110.1 hypothetical protein C4S76_02660 [Apibacter adventoris]